MVVLMKTFYFLLLKTDHFSAFRVFQIIKDKTLVDFNNKVSAQFLFTTSETEVRKIQKNPYNDFNSS